MANSQQFYKRLNQLAGTDKKMNESTDIKNSTLIDIERANDGTALGIVKENHEYFVKVSKVKGDNLSAADFSYIGGFRNKTENQFGNLSEAQKQRNYKLKSLNEAFSLSGKAYLIKEDAKNEKTPLNVKEDINSFLRNRISEGKKTVNESREIKFKDSIKKEKEDIKKKSSSLMSENAITEIRKAMGIITEEKDLSTADSEIVNSDSVAQKADDPQNKHGKDLSTEDSEISDKDEVANKKGKEESQAPINDKNAKKEADKAKGKDSVPAKPKSGKSIAVNEGDGHGDITKDSEIVDGDILPNKKDKKESPQAPINDENAKKEADKNNVGGKVSESKKHDKDGDGDEDKEDWEIARDEKIKDAMGKEDEKEDVSEGKDISTEDSDQDTKGSVAQKEEITTKPDAEYNNYNQPEKGHKPEKGEDLKPIKQKGAIVAEGEALSTEDSEADPADSLANHTNPAPKASGESMIVADSEIEAENSLANESNEAPKKSGESLAVADSELEADDSLANKTGIREGVEDTLAAAEEKEGELDAVDAEADAEAEETPEVPEPDADTSDIDIDNMDLDVADEPAPEGGEEPEAGAEVEVDADAELDGGEEEVDVDAEVDAEPEAESGDEDPMVKEIEKLAGKLGHAVQTAELDPTKTDEIFTAIIGNFENNLSKTGAEKGQEWCDKIEKATAGEGIKGEPEAEVDVEIDAEPAPEMGGDVGMEEDTPMTVDGEEVVDDDIATELGIDGEDEIEVNDPNDVIPDMTQEGSCNECGTFESYVKGRGMNMDECSGMEIADLVSGYADAHKEGMNDGDFENVAVYLVDPQVKQDVVDYGHEDYVGQAEPFIKNVDEGGANRFGSYEPMVDPTMEDDDEIEAPEVGEEVETPESGEDIEVLDLTNKEETPEPTLGLGAEVMDAGVVKPESAKQKSVDVDLNSGKVSVTMSESEEKLRKIIRAKIEEATGKRKPTLNENQKSKTSKKLDKMISEQLKTYEQVIGKKLGK